MILHSDLNAYAYNVCDRLFCALSSIRSLKNGIYHPRNISQYKNAGSRAFSFAIQKIYLWSLVYGLCGATANICMCTVKWTRISIALAGRYRSSYAHSYNVIGLNHLWPIASRISSIFCTLFTINRTVSACSCCRLTFDSMACSLRLIAPIKRRLHSILHLTATNFVKSFLQFQTGGLAFE